MSVTVSGEDEVLQGLNIVSVHSLRLDGQVLDLCTTGHGDGDKAATCGAFNLSGEQFFLRALQRCLYLGGLADQFLHVCGHIRLGHGFHPFCSQ